MRIVSSLTHPRSILVGIAVFLAFFLWPSIPLYGLDVWFETLLSDPVFFVLYTVQSVLMGILASLYVYGFSNRCSSKAYCGPFASVLGAVLAVCPACVPVLSVFLPLGVTSALSYFGPLFSLFSIIAIIFSIWAFGGFE